MKKIIILLSTIAMSVAILVGCAPTQLIADKSGAQLWGENCSRCHNSPTMDQYNKDQWEVIGNHMKIRANITDQEAQKIVAFLQGEN
jgi:cytochrome c1